MEDGKNSGFCKQLIFAVSLYWVYDLGQVNLNISFLTSKMRLTSGEEINNITLQVGCLIYSAPEMVYIVIKLCMEPRK